MSFLIPKFGYDFKIAGVSHFFKIVKPWNHKNVRLVFAKNFTSQVCIEDILLVLLSYRIAEYVS